MKTWKKQTWKTLVLNTSFVQWTYTNKIFVNTWMKITGLIINRLLKCVWSIIFFSFWQHHLRLTRISNWSSEPNRWSWIDVNQSWRRTLCTACKFVRQGILCSRNMSDPEVSEESLTALELFHVCRESRSFFRCRHHLHQLETIRRKNYIRILEGLHAFHCPN